MEKEGCRAGMFGEVDHTDDDDDATEVATAEVVVVNEYMVEDRRKILSGSLIEDIAAMRAAGAEIDNDNEPAEENVFTRKSQKVKVKQPT